MAVDGAFEESKHLEKGNLALLGDGADTSCDGE